MRRILVVRTGGVGDFILILPVLKALREEWPWARIEILGRPHITELARGRGYAEAVRSIDEAEFSRCFVQGAFQEPTGSSPASARGYGGPAEAASEGGLAEYFLSFDLIVSFLPDREGLFEQNLLSLGLHYLAIPPPGGHSLHAAEHFVRSLRPLGIEARDYTPRVYPSADDRHRAEQFLANARLHKHRPLVAIHPGSGSSRKNWPAENFAEVARWLQESQQAELCILAGEADREPLHRLVDALELQPPVAQDLPLTTFAGILEQCSLLIGNDSGISHLAAALGTPVITLFGPTDSRVWQPLGREVWVIRFSEATIQRVKETARAMLEQIGRATGSHL